jgi:hypothetical protein
MGPTTTHSVAAAAAAMARKAAGMGRRATMGGAAAAAAASAAVVRMGQRRAVAAAAMAGVLAVSVYLVVRRFRIAGTEFLLLAVFLLSLLLLAVAARRGAGLREAFGEVAAALPPSVADVLLPSLDRLLQAYESNTGAEHPAEAGAGGGAGGDAAATTGGWGGGADDDVELELGMYADDPVVSGDAERFRRLKFQYKRIQLFLCRLKTYDPRRYRELMRVLIGKAAAAAASSAPKTPEASASESASASASAS